MTKDKTVDELIKELKACRRPEAALSLPIMEIAQVLQQMQSDLDEAMEFLKDAYEPSSSAMRTQWDEEVDAFLKKMEKGEQKSLVYIQQFDYIVRPQP